MFRPPLIYWLIDPIWFHCLPLLRFSSGDLSSELDNAPDDISTTSSQHDAQPVSSLQQGQAYQPTPAPPTHPTQSQSGGDLSLNLRPGSRTTSAPSSPAKTRESLLQRVQSLTGVARDQGASILGKYNFVHLNWCTHTTTVTKCLP